MPKRLPDRWQPESIREFRASARQRFEDGLVAAANGRGTGAIYVWGYSAEMILKAAYFQHIGIPERNVLTWRGDILPAIQKGRSTYNIVWPISGQGHNVQAWAELLVAERINLGIPFPSFFGILVQRQGQRIGQLWREILRYHKNIA